MDWQSALIIVLAIVVLGVYFAGEFYYSAHMTRVPAVRWTHRDTGQWTLMDAYRECCHVLGRPNELKPEAHGYAKWRVKTPHFDLDVIVEDRLLVRDTPYPHHVWIGFTYVLPTDGEVFRGRRNYSWGSLTAYDHGILTAIDAPCLEFAWALHATLLEALITDGDFLDNFDGLQEKFSKRDAKARTELAFSQALEEIMLRGATGKLKDC